MACELQYLVFIASPVILCPWCIVWSVSDVVRFTWLLRERRERRGRRLSLPEQRQEEGEEGGPPHLGVVIVTASNSFIIIP